MRALLCIWLPLDTRLIKLDKNKKTKKQKKPKKKQKKERGLLTN